MTAPADGNVIDDAARKRKRLAQNIRTHRVRRSRGERVVSTILTERQIEHLAVEGYLDGDNTLTQAFALFVMDQMP